ncbi:hypothetical protein NSE_0329 [Neorickettsia sennetsu str. Miyayama]|uniref:Uncharacterized protein n=1 Tax=Ehrlichia sennetsu (strain ATCC VR-367 / Miyayama) TaxID=222891 RepID=Q2GE78_EHRS3|nr:hypothetical protein NSE_0329 [Neorickettsia sennetsu str. Miyayama]
MSKLRTCLADMNLKEVCFCLHCFVVLSGSFMDLPSMSMSVRLCELCV